MSYTTAITSYLNNELSNIRAQRCPGIAETVSSTFCQSAVEDNIPSWTPLRDRAVRAAIPLCIQEVQPYAQCQCLNSSVTLNNTC